MPDKDVINKFFQVYKIQLLVSLVVAIAIIATNVFKTPYRMSVTFIGALFGTFLLDLDYLFYAFILEPTAPFSKTLQGYIKHRDLSNALNHIYYNRSEVKEKTLNSMLFQIALAGAALFAVASTNSLFINSLILSTLANSIYKMAIYYYDGKTKEWFWALKKTPTENGILVYGLILVLVLIYSITLI